MKVNNVPSGLNTFNFRVNQRDCCDKLFPGEGNTFSIATKIYTQQVNINYIIYIMTTVSVREQFVLTNPKAMREIHGFPFQALQRGRVPKGVTGGFRTFSRSCGRYESPVTRSRKNRGARSCSNVVFQLRTLKSQFFHSISLACFHLPAAMV
jgi:hypothetical protein